MNRTPEEWAAHQSQLAERRADLPRVVTEAVSRARTLLAAAPGLQLLAISALRTFTGSASNDPSNALPWQHAEYPTWLYLVDGITNHDSNPLDPATAAEALKAIDEAIDVANAAAILRISDGTDTPTATLRFKHLSSSLSIRNPTFRLQHREHLSALLGPLDQLVEKHFGISPEAMLACEATIFEAAAARIQSLYDEAARTQRRLAPALARRRIKLDEKDQGLVDTLLSRGTPSQRPAMLQQALAMWIAYAAVAAFRVTGAELAALPGAPSAAEFAAYLSLFSASRQAPIGDNLPGLYEALESRPILDLGDGSYFVHMFPKLVWAIKPTLERCLWKNESYKRRRGEFLEQRVAQALGNVFGAQAVLTNLSYEDPVQRPGETFELDVLVTYDRTVILCECKSGTMSFAARRGAPSVVEDLDRLVKEAHEQGVRAARLLRDGTVFTAPDGDQISFDPARIERIVVMIATFDHLSGSLARIADLHDAGLTAGDEPTWALTLEDLEIVVATVPGPVELLHYILRRTLTSTGALQAFDELDFLGCYIKNGLYFEDAAGEVDFIQLVGFDREVVEFYEKRLRGVTSTCPRQPLDQSLRDLIGKLQSCGLDGASEVALLILEGNGRARADLARELHIRRGRARDSGWSAMRLSIGGSVLACVVARTALVTLPDYCRAAKALGAAGRVAGVELHADTGAIVSVFIDSGNQALTHAYPFGEPRLR